MLDLEAFDGDGEVILDRPAQPLIPDERITRLEISKLTERNKRKEVKLKPYWFMFYYDPPVDGAMLYTSGCIMAADKTEAEKILLGISGSVKVVRGITG